MYIQVTKAMQENDARLLFNDDYILKEYIDTLKEKLKTLRDKRYVCDAMLGEINIRFANNKYDCGGLQCSKCRFALTYYNLDETKLLKWLSKNLKDDDAIKVYTNF